MTWTEIMKLTKKEISDKLKIVHQDEDDELEEVDSKYTLKERFRDRDF